MEETNKIIYVKTDKHYEMETQVDFKQITCRIYQTNTQEIPNFSGEWITIGFDEENEDTDNLHDNVINNSRITIPEGKSGKYMILGQVIFSENPDGIRSLRLIKNGTEILVVDSDPATSDDYGGENIVTIENLEEGDYIELQVKQTSGVTLQTVGGREYTYFCVNNYNF